MFSGWVILLHAINVASVFLWLCSLCSPPGCKVAGGKAGAPVLSCALQPSLPQSHSAEHPKFLRESKYFKDFAMFAFQTENQRDFAPWSFGHP